MNEEASKIRLSMNTVYKPLHTARIGTCFPLNAPHPAASRDPHLDLQETECIIAQLP